MKMLGLTPEEQPNEAALVAAQEAMVNDALVALELWEDLGLTEDDLES